MNRNINFESEQCHCRYNWWQIRNKINYITLMSINVHVSRGPVLGPKHYYPNSKEVGEIIHDSDLLQHSRSLNPQRNIQRMMMSLKTQSFIQTYNQYIMSGWVNQLPIWQHCRSPNFEPATLLLRVLCPNKLRQHGSTYWHFLLCYTLYYI